MLRRTISRSESRGAKPPNQRNNVKVSSNTLRSCLLLTPLLALLCLWLYATHYILSTADAKNSLSLREVKNRTKHMNRLIDVIRRRRKIDGPRVGEILNERSKLTLQNDSDIISRNAKVAITSSARGNLGPPSVLNQKSPGKDWLKDRWQAASDMGGTAIPGSHWIVLDFSALFAASEGAVYVTKVTLDWETAYAKDYRLETRVDAPSGEKDAWCVLFDGALDPDVGDKSSTKQYPLRKVEEYGQSPGVKQKLPLHIIHTIDWEDDTLLLDDKCHLMRYVRVFIRKPARGWGVSLWQVDVYGFETLT